MRKQSCGIFRLKKSDHCLTSKERTESIERYVFSSISSGATSFAAKFSISTCYSDVTDEVLVIGFLQNERYLTTVRLFSLILGLLVGSFSLCVESYSGRGDPGGVSKTVVRFRIGAAADSNSSGRWAMTLRTRNQISRRGTVAILNVFLKLLIGKSRETVFTHIRNNRTTHGLLVVLNIQSQSGLKYHCCYFLFKFVQMFIIPSVEKLASSLSTCDRRHQHPAGWEKCRLFEAVDLKEPAPSNKVWTIILFSIITVIFPCWLSFCATWE